MKPFARLAAAVAGRAGQRLLAAARPASSVPLAAALAFAPPVGGQVVPGDPGAVAPSAPVARVPRAPAPGPDQPTPVGLWRTIDDHTGRARSLVRITDRGDGILVGRIEQILEPVAAGAVCEKCDDDRRLQPVIGLEIIRGLRPHDGYWTDGRILNPEDGQIYHLKATPVDGGRRLEMRGYIGLPIFGRTQTWIREP